MVEKKYFLDFGSLKIFFWAFCGIRVKIFFLKKDFCWSKVDFGVKSEKMAKILVKRFSKRLVKRFSRC